MQPEKIPSFTDRATYVAGASEGLNNPIRAANKIFFFVAVLFVAPQWSIAPNALRVVL